MNFYVADYLGDTRHLTTEQHGAYLLLLMTMWRSDGVLSDDPAKLARIAGLTVARWKRIGDDVMAYFTPCAGGITQARLAVELTITNEKSEKNSQAGKLGGRAKALKDKKAHLANAMHTPCPLEPEPIDEAAKATSSPPKRSVAVRGTRLPDDWTPSPECQAFAQTEGLTPQETAREAASFRDYWIGRSGREAIKLDWPATWRNWIRRCDVGKRGPVKAGGTGPRRNGSQPSSMAGILAERRRQAEGANDVSDFGGVFRAG